MPVPCRSASFAPVACCAAVLLACSASAPPVRSCATSEECPATARCISNACVANAPPSTVVTLPSPLQTNVLLSFDASASADPDAGDSVVSFAWSFRALSRQECAVPAVASTGAVANVRFGCPGRYAVDVSSTDEMGGTSTATREFDVAAHAGPNLVTTGADLVFDHACTTAPSRCAPTGAVSLSASTPGIAPDQVQLAWTVVPPADRPLSPSRRVSFSPTAADPAPTVTIETDGDAISGDWVFQVEARDAAGPIGTAAMRVSIGNRPPTVTKTIPTPDHTFTASQFTANGDVPFAVSDADGDPLLPPEVEWHHAGDGLSTFTGDVREGPSRVTFIIGVPYTTRGDSAHLIGGAGLERTIAFAISDVNGGRTVESWPIVVANRPPQIMSEPAPFTVDHTYDPAGRAYVADVPLSTWSDPDGDPLFAETGTSTGDPECHELVLPTGSGVAHARCRLAFVGTPAVGNFAGMHNVWQAIQDPWTPAVRASTVTFTIGNRTPAITSSAAHFVSSGCQIITCCRLVSGEGCLEWKGDLPATSTNVPSRWSDPDGDPLDVDIGGSQVTCVDGTCSVPLDLPPLAAICGIVTQNLAMSVSDGAVATTGVLPLSRECNQ